MSILLVEDMGVCTDHHSSWGAAVTPGRRRQGCRLHSDCASLCLSWTHAPRTPKLDRCPSSNASSPLDMTNTNRLGNPIFHSLSKQVNRESLLFIFPFKNTTVLEAAWCRKGWIYDDFLLLSQTVSSDMCSVSLAKLLLTVSFGVTVLFRADLGISRPVPGGTSSAALTQHAGVHRWGEKHKGF